MPLIVMLMSGGSSLRLITITSVFLLFRPSPFSLLFDFTMFRSCCRSFSFSEIRTVSSAYLRLFTLCPPTRIPGCPSMFRMIISLYRENRSGESTHPCLTPLFIFWNALISPSTRIAAVCSQYIFLMILRSFPSIFNFVSSFIISSWRTLSNALV